MDVILGASERGERDLHGKAATNEAKQSNFDQILNSRVGLTSRQCRQSSPLSNELKALLALINCVIKKSSIKIHNLNKNHDNDNYHGGAY